nr:hypothetical protein B0A51_13354 [Rachicladosporium sp. CCFEE 5018]OQO26876.1 hypothetical protein B0A51_06392 [Rachicladosporium sp. CCFEE 5018]
MASTTGRVGPNTGMVPPGEHDPMHEVLAAQQLLHTMWHSRSGEPYPKENRTKGYVDSSFNIMTRRDNNARIPYCPVLDAYAPCITSLEQLKKIRSFLADF